MPPIVKPLAVVLVGSLVFAQVAHAGTKKSAAPSSSDAPAKPAGLDMNFDLFGDRRQLTSDEEAVKARHELAIERKVHLRRGLLTAHQAVGFATLGLLAATLVLGTLSYVDKYGGGSDTGSLYWWHAGFAGASSTAFAATGMLALFAPNPYPKPVRVDAALMHKILMGIATAGFVAELILGPITAAREGHLDQKNFALAHLIIGYGTFAFMGAGTMTFVFK